jgi:hypothetical protein
MTPFGRGRTLHNNMEPENRGGGGRTRVRRETSGRDGRLAAEDPEVRRPPATPMNLDWLNFNFGD